MRMFVAAVMLALMAAGCSLPAAGPTARQVETSIDPALDAYLVQVTSQVVEALGRPQDEGFPTSFRMESYRPAVILRPGDVVSVSIYETGGTTLFGRGGGTGATSPADSSGGVSQASTLPSQIIEPDGQIIVPFAGRVAIAGRTPSQAAAEITRRLSSQTLGPQVIVSILSNTSNSVAVSGDVNRAGVFPLSLRGERLLDVIAQAGGPRYAAFELDVRIIRGSTLATIPLQRVLSNPVDNIVVRPDDNIVLVKTAKTFVVLGAAAKVAQYSMDAEKVTLAEGIARAGGTVDSIGDLSAIYLFRNEAASVAREIVARDRATVDASFVRSDETRLLSGPRVRMVYRVDLSKTGGYFFSQNIALRDKDIVLVANAEATQMQKIFTLFRGITGMYFDVSRAGTIYVGQ